MVLHYIMLKITNYQLRASLIMFHDFILPYALHAQSISIVCPTSSSKIHFIIHHDDTIYTHYQLINLSSNQEFNCRMIAGATPYVVSVKTGHASILLRSLLPSQGRCMIKGHYFCKKNGDLTVWRAWHTITSMQSRNHIINMNNRSSKIALGAG
jgi:hypothetical protein